MTERVVFTPDAVALFATLKAEHGPLIFHLSGGCCEGSAPMCFRQSDFRVGASDVLLGAIDGCPFYVGTAQFDYWSSCQIIVDVATEGGDSFSLEAAEGVRFIARSRLFTDPELDTLKAAGLPLADASPAETTAEVSPSDGPTRVSASPSPYPEVEGGSQQTCPRTREPISR